MAKTKVQTPFDMMNGMAPESVRENMEKMMSFAGEFTALSRDGITAATESARVSAKGAQELNSKAMAYMQEAMTSGVEATKTVSAAKSVQEAMELQADFAKGAFDQYMKQCGEFASLCAAMMKDAAEPLNAHASQVVEKLQFVK